MSIDLLDQYGHAYAYTDDGERIFSWDGGPLARIGYGGAVHLYDGRHVGHFVGGSVIDKSGNVVLSSRNARGGPMTPLGPMPPLKGIKRIEPMPSLPELPTMRPMKAMVWSRFAPSDVFEG
jgi:hypothetical protein